MNHGGTEAQRTRNENQRVSRKPAAFDLPDTPWSNIFFEFLCDSVSLW